MWLLNLHLAIGTQWRVLWFSHWHILSLIVCSIFGDRLVLSGRNSQGMDLHWLLDTYHRRHCQLFLQATFQSQWWDQGWFRCSWTAFTATSLVTLTLWVRQTRSDTVFISSPIALLLHSPYLPSCRAADMPLFAVRASKQDVVLLWLVRMLHGVWTAASCGVHRKASLLTVLSFAGFSSEVSLRVFSPWLTGVWGFCLELCLWLQLNFLLQEEVWRNQPMHGPLYEGCCNFIFGPRYRSDGKRYLSRGRLMGAENTAKPTAMAGSCESPGCEGRQPWDVAFKKEAEPWSALTTHSVINGWQLCWRPVLLIANLVSFHGCSEPRDVWNCCRLSVW